MSLYSELKDRKVFRVAAVYLVVSWLIMQVVAVVSAPLLLPDWFPRVVILLLTIGFPFALILSWAFDATPAGSSGHSGVSGKPLALGLIALTAVAIGFILTGINEGDSEPETAIATTEIIQEPPPVIPLVEVLEEESVLPNSVAVLLCDNLSPNPDDAYFAAGIHEEILNQLVKLSALNVIARTSVMKYAETDMGIPEIASELKVGSVMECSVRFAGTSILVTAQLIDPISNAHLWSETYPGDIGDLTGVFAMQADIAMNIANALHAEFSLEEQAAIADIPTTSSAAYAAYLKAASLASQTPLAPGSLYDEALELDPNFALALAAKAEAITFEMGLGIDVTEERAQEVFELVEKARSIDPNLADVYLALASMHRSNGRLLQAETAYEQAYKLYPNLAPVVSGYAMIKRTIGEHAESIRLGLIATRLDPNANVHWHQLGVSYLFVGEIDNAIIALKNSLAIGEFFPSTIELGMAYLMGGEYSQAEQLFRELESSEEFLGIPFLKILVSLGYAKMGLVDETNRMLEIVRASHERGESTDMILALAILAAGDHDLAYELLTESLNSEGQPDVGAALVEFKRNRWGLEVLEEPRFVELRNRFGVQD